MGRKKSCFVPLAECGKSSEEGRLMTHGMNGVCEKETWRFYFRFFFLSSHSSHEASTRLAVSPAFAPASVRWLVGRLSCSSPLHPFLTCSELPALSFTGHASSRYTRLTIGDTLFLAPAAYGTYGTPRETGAHRILIEISRVCLCATRNTHTRAGGIYYECEKTSVD